MPIVKEDVMSINRVMISGYLTRDPELRQTSSGMAVLRFGVAVNDRRRNQQTGEWEDYPNFIDCTMFGNRASSVNRFITKGSKVAIEGKLRFSSWEKDGQRRSKLEVIVDEIEFMNRNNNSGDGGNSNATYNGDGYNNSGSYGEFDSGQSNGQGAMQSSQSQALPDTNSANTMPSAMPTVDTSSSVYSDEIPF